MAKVIMVQGTGSSVGKSVIVSALCRIFLQDGLRVCPFKAQNMSLNSFVTKEGGEMGRAQVVQAQASRISPHVDMNPILIKPLSNINAQIILKGKPIANMRPKAYYKQRKKLAKNALSSFERLRKEYEVVVIEGAGSPAEVNLRKNDIVNMHMAHAARSPVILVGDIDKGGVFASLVGTMELLSKNDKERVKGFVINKFRGDKSLLKDGLRFLEKRTKRPVLGVIPYFKDIKLPEEDGVVLERDVPETKKHSEVNIAVIKLPHISNFTDFDALKNEPGVGLSYIDERKGLNGQDIIIIPGTKNTSADLLWLKKTGLEKQILLNVKSKPKTVLVGICGGYQMLGRSISDSLKIESGSGEIKGLGLLPIKTELKPEKVLLQTKAIHVSSGLEVDGYEIHHGKTAALGRIKPMFKVKGKEIFDGAQTGTGEIWGTYLHGVFDSDSFRRHFLNRVRKNKNLPALPDKVGMNNLEKEFNKLACLVRNNIDMKLLYKILKA